MPDTLITPAPTPAAVETQAAVAAQADAVVQTAAVVPAPATPDAPATPATDKATDTKPDAPAETKPADAKADTKPAKYELKAPEGSALDAAHIEAVSAFAGELGLSNEAAQKLVERDAKLLADSQQAAIATYDTQVKAWADQVRADPEIGGAKLDATIKTAQKALAKFGSPELVQMLNTHGYGNHPEVVKFCLRIGASMSEDSIPAGTPGSSPQQKDVASLLYDHPTSQS